MLSSTRSVAMTMLVSVSLLSAPNQDQSSHGMEQPPAVDSLLSLNNEGNRLREQGLCRQAVAVLLRARSAALKELGPAHASIATPTNNLALAYLCLKQFASAERHFRDALTLLYDDSLIETRASILNNLGILLIQLSRTKEAEVTLLQALSLNEALHGSRHPKTALAISSLGVLRLQCGQYAQARDLFNQSLEILEAHLGVHANTAAALNNLGVVHLYLRDYERARQLTARALDMRRQLFPPGHPDVAQSLFNHAVALGKLGERKAARTLFRQAASIESAHASENLTGVTVDVKALRHGHLLPPLPRGN